MNIIQNKLSHLLLISLSLAFITVPSVKVQAIDENKNELFDTFNYEQFDEIHISGNIFAEIIPSKIYKVEVTYSKKHKVNIKLKKSILKIDRSPTFVFFNVTPSPLPRVKIFTPTFTKVKLSGSNDTTIGNYSNKYKLNSVALDIDDSADLKIENIEMNQLQLENGASSNVTIFRIESTGVEIISYGSSDLNITNINTSKLILHTKGSSDVNIEAINSNSVTIESENSSDLYISKTTSKFVNINSDDSSRVTIDRGTSKKAELKTKNSSDVLLSNFLIDTAKLISSGSSTVHIYALNKLIITARESSNIQYEGAPQIKTNISNSATVTQKKAIASY